MRSLEKYGWDTPRQDAWRQLSFTKFVPARIVADHGLNYRVATPEIIPAALSGSLAHKLMAYDMPKIGDWVAIELSDNHQATIQAVLPRTSEIVRGQVGKRHDKQVVAANIDTAFIVQPLDHDFSPERLERYLFQLAGQPIQVIILLNKADKVTDATQKQSELRELNTQSIIINALDKESAARVAQYIKPGKTAVLMGSSGAGKSTLTNQLLNEDRQATQPVREHDSKGRHTTVHRELFVLPNGGMIIDTPGIRELQLWGDYNDLAQAFPEITSAILACHYPRCTHTNEKDCGIKAGLANGVIDPVRLKRFLNFKAELDHLEHRRGFISDRKTQQTRETIKRRHARKQRANQDRFDSWA